MSFASDTKLELARVIPEKKCCMLAEIAGFIRICGRVALVGNGKFKIKLTTESPAIARHYKMLLKSYFAIDASIEVGQAATLKKGKYFTLVIGPEDLSEQILRESGILMIREGKNYLTDGIFDGLIKTKCCRKAYLRGVFLGAGTMTNPEREYLFEINCASRTMASDVKKLINSFVDIHDCMTGWAECISAEGNVRKVSVKDNTVDDTGNIGIDLSGNYGYCKNASLDFPRNCTVSGNTVSNCRSSYGDTAYGIYIDGGQKISVSENDVSNCSGGIEIGAEQKPKSERYSTGSIKITKNKIENNIENGITIGGYEKKLGNVRHVDIVGNICLENGCKSGAILTLSKCCYINMSKNRLQNTKGNAYVVYSDFHKRYTNHLHFYDNIYCNGHNANDTAFEYLGKNYSSFARWKSVAGKSAGTYAASKSLKKTLRP